MIKNLLKLFYQEKDYIDEFNQLVLTRLPWMDTKTLKIYVSSYLTVKDKFCRDCEVEAALIQLDLDEFGTVCVKQRVDEFMKFYKEIAK